MANRIQPVSPGELLKEDFLEPMGLSRYRLAKEIGVPASRIGQIIAGRRSITADTDLRLCRFFSLADGYWLRAQAAYDLETTRHKIAHELDHIRRCKTNELGRESMMRRAFSEKAWTDYLYWHENDESTLERINALIEDIDQAPYEGMGEPEALCSDRDDLWSRRIDKANCLVYKIEGGDIVIISCKGLYR